MSALGQKQTFAVQNAHVRFTPKSGHCSALADVRFVPIADIANLIRFDPLRAQTVDVKMVSRSRSSSSIIFALCATASLNKSRIETTAITLPLSTTGR